MTGNERYFGALIWAAIFTVTAIVCFAVGLQMKRAGMSTRPIWWFAGFMLLVGGPQFAYHLWSALRPEPAARSFTGEQQIFGSGVDLDLIRDMRPAFGPVFAEAGLAKMAVRRTGESITVARFADAQNAAAAVDDYLRFLGLAASARPAAQGGMFAARANDVIVARAVGPWFIAWAGASEEQIAGRQRELGLGSVPDEGRPSGAMMAVAVLLLTILAVVYFFKGTAWAGRIDPAAGTTPVSAAELVSRLEKLNLERESDGHWRIAWSPTPERRQKISLALDEAHRTVRATDFLAANYSSAANVNWCASGGIVFFQTGSHNRIKQPIIDAVTASGWRWQPVLWSSLPSWLAWLSE
jgi:hypothetical protein